MSTRNTSPRSIRLGAVVPQTELPPDAGAARHWFAQVEQLRFDHALIYDHVLGADTSVRPGWSGAYEATDPFLEVMVALAWAAGFTERLELATGVVILPQRQTALVAKQAATIDHLSGGRLRLGVGIGWNKVEYDALNEQFNNRGKRLEEQIALMRRLWTEPVVTFEGEWHHVDHAGILPLPVQRPIPVWIGASADVAIRRAARLADGFYPQGVPSEKMEHMLAVLFEALERHERDRETFGIEARITVSTDDEAEWRRQAAWWREKGITHLSLNTMRGGLTSIEAHLEAFSRGREALLQEIG
ncbi:MAG TPA: LLM class F420-dependent oxidoreductase [Thermomicrobiales bacterium]|nr:LLM class F420-dependent oxidoreductase [Thermomicrobiales bacterium]